MNNPVLVLTHNNLDLTMRCVKSIFDQDITVDLFVYDNGSTDRTHEWLHAAPYTNMHAYINYVNQGVSRGWNSVLGDLFDLKGYDHCLVVGNDTILAPWTYSSLLFTEQLFVTGVDIGMNPLPERPDILPLSPHPDFSCFLIQRECWEIVGPFNEQMVSYASDCDYHARAHVLGVPLYKASVPYNHERSSTIKNASPQEQKQLHMRANLDREEFKKRWGFLPGTPAYNDFFQRKGGNAKT